MPHKWTRYITKGDSTSHKNQSARRKNIKGRGLFRPKDKDAFTNYQPEQEDLGGKSPESQ